MHHCEIVCDCRLCKLLSRTVGHFLMFVFRKKWPRLERNQVVSHMRGLDLELVGGLRNRGWTVHDIDVVGNMHDVPKLIERVRKVGISNPIHFCDKGFRKHSHIECIKDGLEVLFLGDRMYKNIR